jgi:predicted ferric reductase
MTGPAADDKAAEAAKGVRRNRVAMWLWLIVLLPPVNLLFFVLDFETYVKIMTLLTANLSVIALSLGHLGALKGARAEKAGYENP